MAAKSSTARQDQVTSKIIFVDGYRRPPIPAETVFARIQQLQQTKGGRLMAQDVVEDARPVGSALHSAFEWNDGIAGEKFRCWQARNLMHSLRLITIQDGVKTSEHRVILSVPKTDENERVYMSAQSAMANPKWRTALLEQAARDLASWRARYQDLAELADIFPVIDEFLRVHTPEKKKAKKSKTTVRIKGVQRT